MACICGHAIEDHRDCQRECDHETLPGEQECLCVWYEEEDTDD